MLCVCFVGVAVFRLVGVELLLRSLLATNNSVLVLKPLPSIKIRYIRRWPTLEKIVPSKGIIYS
jgi:hypothetical protein